jgi:hypothetical protein
MRHTLTGSETTVNVHYDLRRQNKEALCWSFFPISFLDRYLLLLHRSHSFDWVVGSSRSNRKMWTYSDNSYLFLQILINVHKWRRASKGIQMLPKDVSIFAVGSKVQHNGDYWITKNCVAFRGWLYYIDLLYTYTAWSWLVFYYGPVLSLVIWLQLFHSPQ